MSSGFWWFYWFFVVFSESAEKPQSDIFLGGFLWDRLLLKSVSSLSE